MSKLSQALVASLFTSVDSDDVAKADKGKALQAAHAALDKATPAQLAQVDKDIAAIRPEGNKDKRIERAYKLGKRFIATASFLQKHGLSFATVGAAITGTKKTVSLNLVESIRSAANNKESAYHEAAQAWQSSKDFAAWLVDCGKADKQAAENAKSDTQAQIEAQAAALANSQAQVTALEAEVIALRKAAGKRSKAA